MPVTEHEWCGLKFRVEACTSDKSTEQWYMRYVLYDDHIPRELTEALDIYVKYNYYGGLDVVEYLTRLFGNQ